MIREALTAGSRQVTLAMRPDGSVQYISRAATGATTTYSTGGRSRWLRLVRSNSTFTAYVSADGAAWQSIGSRTVAMGVNVWVGLAVCSHTTSALNTATFDSVRVSAAAGGTDLPPTVSITSPTNGSTFPAGATIAITANASDDTGPAAKVDFYANNGTANQHVGTDTSSPYSVSWTNVAAGSYSLSAVATDTANQSTTSSPVSVTVSAGGGKTVKITGPPDGSTFPPGTGIVVSAAATLGTSPGVLSHVMFWANDGTTTRNIGVGFAIGRDGTDVISYTPWWHNVPAGTYTVTAVATYGYDQLVTSQPVRVRVSTTPGADAPPTVVFTYPTAGTPVPPGSTIIVTAEAADPDGTPVARVDFWESTYEGWRLLGSKTAPPYAVSWSDGGYTGEMWLLAVVTDTAGLATSRWLYVTR